jgi:hypothetical protein
LGCISLHEFNVLPAMFSYAKPRLVKHGIRQVNANDPALWANSFLHQREIESGPTANINHKVTAFQV